MADHEGYRYQPEPGNSRGALRVMPAGADRLGRAMRNARGASVAAVPGLPSGPVRDKWRDLKVVTPGMRRHFLTGSPLVDYFRSSPVARGFDQLRTELLQTLRRHGWHRVAITSPTPGCGTTFTAVNLGQGFARIDQFRTVLMDLNFRSPGVAAALELECHGDTGAFLRGELAPEDHIVRTPGQLGLGLTRGSDAHAAERLQDARIAPALNQLTETLSPDVVLFDLPPMLCHDDMLGFLPRVDGVVLVIDATQTTADQILKCKRMLSGRTGFVDVVVNRARRVEPGA